MSEQKIPTIVYHQVLDDGTSLASYTGAISSGQMYLSDFIQQMDYLVEQGFTPITHDQLYRWLIGEAKLSAKPIKIDFDDHSMISYVNALPAMQHRNLIATMYVISGFADGDPACGGAVWSAVPRMRWRELEKLIAAGWEIAAHTVNHLFLGQVSPGAAGDTQIMDELVRSAADIEANLKITPRHFAYPGGSWDERCETFVKQVYKSARQFQWEGCCEYVGRDTDRYRLPGMNINHATSFEAFKDLVNGVES